MADGVVVKIDGDSKEFENQLKGLGGAAKIGLAAVAAAVAAVSGAMAYASQVGMEYESSLAKVGTIADTSSKSLQAISDEVKNLSADTGVAAADLNEAVYQAISAGVDTAKSVEFVAQATKLAKGGFADTTSTVDLLTTVLNAYGKSADEAGTVSDVLMQIQNKGKTTVAELSANMGKVIPTANAYGVSLENLGAGYAKMTANGIATAETTTYLNSMLNELGKSGTTASDTLKKSTGKTFKQLMDSGKNLGEVLQILQDEADKSGLSMGDMFGSAEAGKAAMVLAKGGVDGFNASLSDMQNSAGLTETAYETMQDTTETALEKMKNNLKNAGITFFDKFKEPMKDGLLEASDAFKDLTKSMSSGKLSNSIQNLGKKFGDLIKKLAEFAKQALPKVIDGLSWLIDNLPKIIRIASPIVAGILAYNAAVKIAAVVQGAWNAVMNMNPIGAVVGAVALLVTGIGLLAAAQSAETEEEKKQREVREARIAATDEAREKIKEEAAAFDELRTSTWNATEADRNNLDRIQALVEELPSLVDANGKVKESCEDRANYILGEYNKALGTEYDRIDDLVTKNGELKDGILEAIKAKKAQIEMNAMEEQYKKAIESYLEKEKLSLDLSKQISEAKQAETQSLYDYCTAQRVNGEEISKIQEKIREESEKGSVASRSALESYAKEIEKLNENTQKKYEAFAEDSQILADKQAAYDQNEADLNEYYATIGAYETASVELSKGNYDKVVEIIENKNNAFKTATSVVNESAEEQKRILGQQAEDTEKLARQIEQKWKDGVAGVSEEMVKAAKDRAEAAAKEAKEVGAYFSKGVGNGIASEISYVEQKSEQMMIRAMNKAQKTADERSPSKKGKQIGAFFTQGVGIGIETDKSADKAAESTVQTVLDKFKDMVIPQSAIDLVSSAAQRVPAFLSALTPSSIFTAPALAGIGSTTQNTYNTYNTEKQATIIDNVLTLDGEVIYQNQKNIADRKGIDISTGGDW